MSQDKEFEIRRQFLDEAQEYLNTLDSAILGLAHHRVDGQKINAALRAAHSIKGGAGLMGFEVLSHLAHRLEDSFKALKVQKSLEIDTDLENLLLAAVGCLRRVIEGDRQATPPDRDWLETDGYPIFEQLHQILGDPQDEDAHSILSPEEGQDVIPMLFETEVEGCLQRLEAVLEDPDQPCLREEVTILAQELAGLGEMLQLAPFTRLCESVTQALDQVPDRERDGAIAQVALKAWRRTQALVLTGQFDLLPTEIELPQRFDSTPSDSTPSDSTPSDNTLSDRVCDLQESAIDPQFMTVVAETSLPAIAALEQSSSTPRTQPDSTRKRSTVRESQVTDFKILDTGADTSDAIEEDQDATVRVSVRQLNQLNDLFGELAIDRNGLDLYLKRLRNLTVTLQQRLKTLEHLNAQMRTACDKMPSPGLKPPIPLLTGSAVHPLAACTRLTEADRGIDERESLHSKFDVLEMDRYSDLHLLAQEVMETTVQIQELTSDLELSLDDAEQTSRSLSKTARQLQTNLTQIRMRPLSDVVDRFPRALRELALQYGKPVRLNIVGGSTLIDRNILEQLNDPLMHLLRNAFDHGIEDPATRKARGKPAEGQIEIRANHRGNRTCITVSDDGGGIPLDKVRDRAEQMGLDATLLANASDEELLTLIFEPGFSTTDQVTALSGRGMGMDVVRDNLRRIRGEITVNTQAGTGTTFILSVPFTLSIARVLLVESHGMLLAFPTDVVKEMLLLKPEDVINTAGSEALNYQQRLVQLVRLPQWLVFHCPRHPHNLEVPPAISAPVVLIVNQGNQPVGLQVDRSWGEQEVAIRRIEGSIPMPPGFNHCIIMGDGRVVPLVNVSDLLHWISHYERPSDPPPASPQPFNLASASRAALPPAVPPAPVQKATILIVDDSINVRRFLALMLERAGYRVEQAKDGQDALEKLLSGLSVEAILCDIEMPRLDGYGFLSKVKAIPQLESIPVAMLTSRSGEKHRQLAINLGAAAYFAKPYNEQTLLRAIAQLVATD
jgi:chemosensory pili system protein ChpA (sensor histidine kinase/response regulator)